MVFTNTHFNIQNEAEKTHFKKINKQMLVGWMIIASVLLITYIIEVFKGTRPLGYVLVFVPVVVVPPICALFSYRKNSGSPNLCYFVMSGYFLLYLFVMLTGRTIMVSTYILPMLSLLVLCHRPKLILTTGAASLAINLISIGMKIADGQITKANSDEREIQVALIILCFLGSYFAAKIYDGITNKNYEYLAKLSEKNEQIENMSIQSITTIANMIDARDSYTEGHSQRVADYSALIARGLGFSEEEIENVHTVALLHDIGKVGISDTVLNKPGRLTDDEYSMMKMHATIGSEIIKNVETIHNIYNGVRYHHERYDGKGYPDGLKGDNIPYIARIIAVADAFDAMTSNRVYRQHLPYEKVISELEKGIGTQFDPEISKTMLVLLRSGSIQNLSPDM